MHLGESNPGDGGAQVIHVRLHAGSRFEENPRVTASFGRVYGGCNLPKAILRMALRRSIMLVSMFAVVRGKPVARVSWMVMSTADAPFQKQS